MSKKRGIVSGGSGIVVAAAIAAIHYHVPEWIVMSLLFAPAVALWVWLYPGWSDYE